MYKSLDELIYELGGDDLNLVAMEHPALNYLAGPCFEAMTHANFEIVRDIHATIIPPAEG